MITFIKERKKNEFYSDNPIQYKDENIHKNKTVTVEGRTNNNNSCQNLISRTLIVHKFVAKLQDTVKGHTFIFRI